MTLCAVITGASQGIGEAIALACAREPGARLFLIARNEASLERVAQRCRLSGAITEALPCDLTKDVDVERVAQGLLDRGIVPTLLVNNAGRFVQQEFFSISPTEFRDTLDVNLVSAFLITRALAPAMAQSKQGTIIFMGSVASIRGYPLSGAYCTAKHGLLGMARSLRLATQDTGLRVTTVMPGATDTPSWNSSDVPKARLMPAEDIAESVLSIYKLSSRSVVEEIVLRPQEGDL